MKQIPYQTNKASLVEKIADLVENKVPFWLVMCIFVTKLEISCEKSYVWPTLQTLLPLESAFWVELSFGGWQFVFGNQFVKHICWY